LSSSVVGTILYASPGAPPAARAAIRVLRFRYEMLKELDGDYSRG